MLRFTAVIIVLCFLFHIVPVGAQVMTRPLNVTTTVLPNSSEGQVLISAEPASGVQGAGTAITYTIQYRSQSGGTWPFTVEGSWTEGLVDGTSSTYVDVLEYQVGSATNTDNGTTPVVDTVNRTITWDMPALSPSTTYHEVSFVLVVRSDIAPDQTSVSTISASGSLNGETLTEHSVQTTVRKDTITPTATPTVTPQPSAVPTPGSSSGSTPTPTALPTPTVAPPLLSEFKNVKIIRITDSSAVIRVITTNNTRAEIIYGTDKKKLNEKKSANDLNREHTFELSGLRPDTIYYFQIYITTADGRRFLSDLFTFRTARNLALVSLRDADITISSNNILLSTRQAGDTGTPPSIIATPLRSITVSIKLNKPRYVKSLRVRLRNARVLGLEARASEPPIQEVQLLELFPGVFSGELRVPPELGEYDLEAIVRDTEGGFSTEIIPTTFYISDFLRVLNKNGSAIENATVIFRRRDLRNNTFIPLQQALSYTFKTDFEGALDAVIPTGIYEVTVSAIGYRDIKETIDLTSQESYPIFTLTPDFSIGEIVRYYEQSMRDTTAEIVEGMQILFVSKRAQDVSFLMFVMAVFFCGLLALSIRLHTSIIGIPLWIIDHGKGKLLHFMSIRPLKKCFMVYEGNNYHKNIPGVKVVIMDKNHHTIASFKTDLIGKGEVPKALFEKALFPLTVFTYRAEHLSHPTTLTRADLNSERINLFMTKEYLEKSDNRNFLAWLVDLGFIFISDVFLIGVVILTVLMLLYYGFFVSIPYLVMSSILLLFWFMYLHQIWKFQRDKR